PAADRVYVATYSDGLYAVAVPGGATRLVASGFTGVIDLALAADGSVAYALDQLHGTVVQVDLVRGGSQVVATGLGNPVGIAASSTPNELFVADEHGIMKVDTAAGVVTAIATTLAGVTGLTVDGRRGAAYVTSHTSGLVKV